VADQLKTAGLPVSVLTAGQMAAASGQVRAALTARPPLLICRDHPAMQAAISSARKRKVGGSWAWDRGAVTLPLNALTAAWWARDHAPAPAEEPAVFA
jgi:hypothetical protein